MADRQHIELLKEGVDAWNRRREIDQFTPDLSGFSFAPADPIAASVTSPFVPMAKLRHLPKPPAGWIGACFHGINLSGANLLHTRFNRADLTDANLSNANLEHANLNEAFLCRANMQGARLNDTILNQANLIGADLTRASLNNASLQGASLTDANLTGAILTGAYLNSTWTTRADFIRTDLADVRHLPPELWKAKLFQEDQSPEQQTIRSIPVNTVENLLRVAKEIKESHKREDEIQLYFRGESRCGWELRPAVMRNDSLFTSEGKMLVELTSRRPGDFVGASSAVAQWVLAQHHGLPTRFLDVTGNPLVALYHACEVDDPRETRDGRLHVFAVPQSLVKPFNSDTVSIIANVAKLSRDDQYELVPEPSLRNHEAMRRLYQHIRIEKPYFDERIDPRDFYRVFVVEPQQVSERIRAQAGAFLASVFHTRFERDEILKWNADIPVYKHYELTVSANHKQTMREELRLLSVTKENLFPGLDASAEAITDRMLISVKPWASNDGSVDIRFAKGVPK
ncbi:MAG: pentapeptide repeat-containing protein [Gemmatimonadota bacterium]|nr:pentapeptide repeat-containing protein [Gemmatimonadota bacterium]